MKKVLIVNTVGLLYDGITNIMMSYIRAMDKDGIEIYIASTNNAEPGILQQLEQDGCNIVYFPSRKWNTLRYLYELSNYIRKNKIDVVHAHGNSSTLIIEMFAGWLGGCEKRIAHSHNTQCDHDKLDRLLRPLFYLFYTDAVACGEEAGRWLFRNRQFTVLKNGRNIDEFSYNVEKRNEIRKRLQIDNKIVIGHVGGFYKQKNHIFLLNVFRSIIEIEPDAQLLLLGDGPLEEEIKCSIKDVENKVLFLGTTNHVGDYLQAMDGVLLPSLFEGLPLVAIEWQINGLPCLFSDTITKDCGLMPNIKFISLSEAPKIWAGEILNLIKNNNRVLYSEMAKSIVKNAGFDISQNADQLHKLYVEDGRES